MLEKIAVLGRHVFQLEVDHVAIAQPGTDTTIRLTRRPLRIWQILQERREIQTRDLVTLLRDEGWADADVAVPAMLSHLVDLSLVTLADSGGWE